MSLSRGEKPERLEVLYSHSGEPLSNYRLATPFFRVVSEDGCSESREVLERQEFPAKQ